MNLNMRRVINHSYSNKIDEVTRKNLVGKNKAQSPDRFKRKSSYHALSYNGIHLKELLEKDLLVVEVPVGDYTCTLAYTGVLSELGTVLKSQPRPNVTLQSVIRALQRSIDNTDVLVDCTCADFTYRFSYYATKYGYKYGTPETRPPKKTNPKDNLGATCKHLSALLYSKRWLVKLATSLNNLIKQYTDDFRKAMKLQPNEFIINSNGRPSAKTGRNTGMLSNADNTNDSVAANDDSIIDNAGGDEI